MQGEPNLDAARTWRHDAPADGVAAIVTLAASDDETHVVDMIVASYDSTPAGGNLLVQDGEATLLVVDISDSRVCRIPFLRGLAGRPGEALTVTLAGGGGAVSGKLNVQSH